MALFPANPAIVTTLKMLKGYLTTTVIILGKLSKYACTWVNKKALVLVLARSVTIMRTSMQLVPLGCSFISRSFKDHQNYQVPLDLP